MNADWDEIKRLAADFQKAQLSSTLQRLSERNCIEVVTLLLEKNLLDLLYTTDGKEYLTQDQLQREIEDELFVNSGRINLVELSRVLNVDLQKVSFVAERIAVEDPKITLILGQLVSTDYIIRTASEINEKLILNGEINISELTVHYDLPSDFLLKEIVEKNLGRIIFGKQDSSNPRLLYTQSFISRCKAKVRGSLVAITQPTSVSTILSQNGIQERIFFSFINEINATGSLTSRSLNGQYVPHIYTRSQSDWLRNFFKQNCYLEYESVIGLGISATDPKAFIQKQLSGEKLTFLNKCAIGQRIIDQVESTLEESIATNSFLDITSILPSIISDEDIEQLIQVVLTPSKQRLTQLFGSIVLTTKYVDVLLKPVYELADGNAKTSVEKGEYQKFVLDKQINSKSQTVDKDEDHDKSDKRDERRKKAAGGKAGGGAQGRETKTKSTKKQTKSRTKDDDSGSDDESANFAAGKKNKSKDQLGNLVTVQEIKKAIIGSLENDGLEELGSQIANYYHPQISKYCQNKASELYTATLQNNLQSRKQNHSTLQDKLNNLLNDIRLYEKGLKLFTVDTQQQLVKYLLKSLGTDFCNELSIYVAGECNLNAISIPLTIEQRNRITIECDQEYKPTLVALIKALNGTIEDFLVCAENALIPCSMILKKIDKKKDKLIILGHKHGLLDQLYKCNDPSLVLHLACLVIFTISTQNMLHASGRFVSSILMFLRPNLTDEQNQVLMNFHDLVMKLLTTNNDEMTTEVTVKLDELIPAIKDLAANYKKTGAAIQAD